MNANKETGEKKYAVKSRLRVDMKDEVIEDEVIKTERSDRGMRELRD